MAKLTGSSYTTKSVSNPNVNTKYPPTIYFASSPSENKNLVSSGAKSRRPGGAMRGKGPWKTSGCKE